ncbi:MAG: hypothetical protein NTV40_04435 [Solirubrobacterales bacterium]|nr:hypothetical protein [Solirubrobacterales bacterium]
MTDLNTLSEMTERLRVAAGGLREADITAERAAQLVDECARLALEAAAELERQARDVGEQPAAQESLLSGQDRLL